MFEEPINLPLTAERDTRKPWSIVVRTKEFQLKHSTCSHVPDGGINALIRLNGPGFSRLLVGPPPTGRVNRVFFRAVVCVIFSVILAIGTFEFLTVIPEQARIFGLSISGDGQNSLSAELAVGRSVERHVDIINLYVAWSLKSALPLDTLHSIEMAGAVPEITWEPWNPIEGVEQPTYRLANIAGGKFDEYLEQWGRALAAYGGPVFMRFAQEMNGTWYPWSVLRNGGSPPAYVKAFRHVRDTLRHQGAVNLHWVFSPNIMIGNNASAITESFPGGDWADIVGIDGYNFGRKAHSRQSWISPKLLFDPTLQVVRHIAPRDEIWINETATTQQGGDPIAWVQKLFAYMKGAGIKGVIWFEIGSDTHAPLRLAGTPAAVIAARLALSAW